MKKRIRITQSRRVDLPGGGYLMFHAGEYYEAKFADLLPENYFIHEGEDLAEPENEEEPLVFHDLDLGEDTDG